MVGINGKKRKLKNSIFYHLSNKLLYFAGIYNHTRCCAIVTVHAQEKIKFIHNRQLLLIDEYNIKNWLSGENNFNDNITKNINVY